MKYIKKYENLKINLVSSEFWKMTEVVDWNSLIYEYHNNFGKKGLYKSCILKAKKRLYTNYTYDEIKNFYKEYIKLFIYLHGLFKPTWLEEEDMPSDDGYLDLISSIIGCGEEYTNKFINDINFLIKNRKHYMENFGNIFPGDEEEYIETLYEIDPEKANFYKDYKKYNL